MTALEKLTALYTIFRKETIRLFRIWLQTLIPPIITQTLYFLVFGAFIGSRIGEIEGVPYIAFIVPGLIMMTIITNSFMNVVSSFFGSKFQKNIEEMLVSPMPNWTILAGYVSGGVLRGLIVGLLVFIVSMFFTEPQIHNIFIMFLFALMVSIFFSLAGFLNGLFAQKFDDVSIFPTFVLTPLIYLGGVFYSLKNLPEFWQQVSKLNPVFYMIDGFRYGFYGISDINLWYSISMLIIFIVTLIIINLHLLNKGTGLKN
jgi:ABC-2 type transport system permease protein